MITTDAPNTVDMWREAAGAAEEWAECPIDTEENTPGTAGQLGAWLCNEVYGVLVVGEGDGAQEPTADVIYGAISALEAEDRDAFTPAEFLRVLATYRGETVSDFRTLAEEYADDHGYKLVGLKTDDEYHIWYAENGIPDGEVCGETEPGGTLVWFNKNNW
jgi:hypothetical protein